MQWKHTDGALVHVVITGVAFVSIRTVAVEFAIHRIGVTLRTRPARVTNTRIINVTQ